MIVTHTQRERGRDTSRGKSRLHAGSPTWDSIPASAIRPWAAGGTKPLSHPVTLLTEEETPA